MKAQILESLGYQPTEQFPVYVDRFPNQMLAFIRLSRVSDPALFAKASGRMLTFCMAWTMCLPVLASVVHLCLLL
jgi:hypothetical protein